MGRVVNKLKHLVISLYKSFYFPYKEKKIRKKEKIIVLFVVNDLPTWKTERLYCSMLEHNRFSPIIGIAENQEELGLEKIAAKYCESSGYKIVHLESCRTLVQQTKADIIFYQKPYWDHYLKNHHFQHNRKALYAYAYYAFHTVEEEWTLNASFFQNCWQFYFENEICGNSARQKMDNKGKNIRVTGIPYMDELSQGKKLFSDPWNDTKKRKRIIYAPHHTIGSLHLNGINYSTFLEYAEFILQIAEKYSENTFWTFKPHPLLKSKLMTIWGKEQTDNYYERWSNLENGQYSSGKYVDLFMYSDAMIHDCGSFTIEYLYTGNPVMYLVKDNHHIDNLNKFAIDAFNCHYHGKGKEEIEQFVLDVISEKDPMKDCRNQFKEKFLQPPYGKTACQNIINAILGIEEFK